MHLLLADRIECDLSELWILLPQRYCPRRRRCQGIDFQPTGRIDDLIGEKSPEYFAGSRQHSRLCYIRMDELHGRPNGILLSRRCASIKPKTLRTTFFTHTHTQTSVYMSLHQLRVFSGTQAKIPSSTKELTHVEFAVVSQRRTHAKL
jgi:hypothetical protein